MSEKWEKAQPDMSNKVQEIGKVEREEEIEGIVDTGNEGEDNEGLKGEGILMSEETEPELKVDNVLKLEDNELELWEEAEETKDVGEGLKGIAEELEG